MPSRTLKSPHTMTTPQSHATTSWVWDLRARMPVFRATLSLIPVVSYLGRSCWKLPCKLLVSTWTSGRYLKLHVIWSLIYLIVIGNSAREIVASDSRKYIYTIDVFILFFPDWDLNILTTFNHAGRLAWKEKALSQPLMLCLERMDSSLTLCPRLCTGLRTRWHQRSKKFWKNGLLPWNQKDRRYISCGIFVKLY